MSKRISDVVLAGLGLLLTWPLFLVIALLIKLDSRGPVFFRQERVGKDGRPFRIFKFRTMVNDAYRLGPKLTQKRDPRVTRIGQILRWLKLDELPQLLNVLRGDMGLVGPRPEDPHFVRLYTPRQRAVLAIRPGIVGPSQILGRDELELYPEGVDTEEYYISHILPAKLETDLEYVRHANLWHDLTLLVRGITVTILGSIKPRYLRRESAEGPLRRVRRGPEPRHLPAGVRPQVRLGRAAQGSSRPPGRQRGHPADPSALFRVLRALPEHRQVSGHDASSPPWSRRSPSAPCSSPRPCSWSASGLTPAPCWPSIGCCWWSSCSDIGST